MNQAPAKIFARFIIDAGAKDWVRRTRIAIMDTRHFCERISIAISLIVDAPGAFG
jgi:hypothetical protein